MWGKYWMTYIQERADERGVDVYVTDMFDDIWKAELSENFMGVVDHPELYSFFDISQVNSRNFNEEHWSQLQWLIEKAGVYPRPVNHTKIYGSGNTSWGSGSPEDGVERFWRNLIGGSAAVRFHRPTVRSDAGSADPA